MRNNVTKSTQYTTDFIIQQFTMTISRNTDAYIFESLENVSVKKINLTIRLKLVINLERRRKNGGAYYKNLFET